MHVLAISLLALEPGDVIRPVVIGVVTFMVLLIGHLYLRRRYLRQNPASGRSDTQLVSAHDAVREQQAETLEQLKARIAEVQAQRDRAQSERARLLQGLNELGGGEGPGGITVALANAKDVSDRARELTEQESALATHDKELSDLANELGAAEQLLNEVDAQRDALKRQVSEQSKELYRLRAEVEATQRKSFEQRARTLMLTRSNVRKVEVVANRMEDQLKHWVKNTGATNVNWSEHGHASIVAEAFSRIDREFIDRYFSHVTNPEYSRGQQRAIRVTTGNDPDGTEYGELLIALDDDAGRTLGLRFELKKEAPDAACVGFVLAMYLRAMTRDLRDYTIIVK